MTDYTPRLGYRSIAQTELPHAFNSQTVCKLESAGVTVMESVTLNTPPTDPLFGETYFVPDGDAGTVWEGFVDTMTYWTGGAWERFPAAEGLVGYNKEDDLVVTRQGGAWVSFDESIVITSTVDILKPDAFVHVGVQRYQFTQTSPFSVSTERGIGPLFTQGATGTSTRPAGMPAGGRTGFLTLNATDKAQLYPLYRYVGDYSGSGALSQPTMPRLIDLDLRVDLDSDVCWSFPMLQLVLVKTDPGTTVQVDTWADTNQGGIPVQHRKDDEFWSAETVLTLQRPVVAANTGRHVIQYRELPDLELEPGYLMLQVNGANSLFGQGNSYSIRDTIATVTANLTVSADF